MTAIQVPPPFSTEVEGTPPDDGQMIAPKDPDAEQAMRSLYGSDFPLLDDPNDEAAWVSWIRQRWAAHTVNVRSRLHLVERNRLFRADMQWIAAQGFGPWKEPVKPRDAARVVVNMIAPALDLRQQIVSEQRPGFRVKPATQDPDDMKKADAQQLALEYQFEQQAMERTIKALEFWAGTDGCSFLECYWDPDRGPWHEAQTTEGQPHRFPLGDVHHRVLRIEQVRVSPDATATVKPWYWMVRDVLPTSSAVRMYGPTVAKEAQQGEVAVLDEMRNPIVVSGYTLPDHDELLRDQDTVERFTMYCEPSEYLDGGLQLTVVGNVVVRAPMPLLTGVVPMVRVTDGSSDPAFYPRPIMDVWVATQQRINAIISKWVENIRMNSGTKYIAKEHAIVGETLVGSSNTIISVKGLDDINKVIRPLEAYGVGQDAKELYAIQVRHFENLTGWNDVTRGSFSSEQSGRAILAIREQLERVFAPVVASMAFGLTDWGKITLAFMAWGYDLPRVLGVEGQSRPDLARALQGDDFDGAADVWIDPETMMPMPRALKLFQLDDALEKQIISVAEYRRRMPYANIRNLATPDDDQDARARRCCEAVRQTANPMAEPILWQDDEAIHQDVLERELIIAANIPPEVQAAASQRWLWYAQQAQQKQGVMPQQPMPSQGQPPKKSGNAAQAGMNAQQQPLLGSNPSTAAGGVADQQNMARQFDQQAQR